LRQYDSGMLEEDCELMKQSSPELKMVCPNDKPNSSPSSSPTSKPTPHQPELPEPDLIKQFTLNDNSDKLPPLPMMPGAGNQELNISTMTGDIEEALKNLEMDISDK
jgi:hypothetical protein